MDQIWGVNGEPQPTSSATFVDRHIRRVHASPRPIAEASRLERLVVKAMPNRGAASVAAQGNICEDYADPHFL